MRPTVLRTTLPLLLAAAGCGTDYGITPPPDPTDAGAFATAPPIGVPATGNTVDFLDAGPFSLVPECDHVLMAPCRVYKVVVTASQKIGFAVSWEGTADLGVFTYDAARTYTGILCDAKGNGAAGQPETCSASFSPGTYYLAVVSFGSLYDPPDVDPASFRLMLTGLP